MLLSAPIAFQSTLDIESIVRSEQKTRTTFIHWVSILFIPLFYSMEFIRMLANHDDRIFHIAIFNANEKSSKNGWLTQEGEIRRETKARRRRERKWISVCGELSNPVESIILLPIDPLMAIMILLLSVFRNSNVFEQKKRMIRRRATAHDSFNENIARKRRKCWRDKLVNCVQMEIFFWMLYDGETVSNGKGIECVTRGAAQQKKREWVRKTYKFRRIEW